MILNKDLLKSLAKLKSFRVNLPKGRIAEMYVIEFNEILTSIEEITGEDLRDFVVADDFLTHRVSRVSPTVRMGGLVTQQGGVTYTKGRFCDREWILLKVDGAINYLELLMPT